MMILPRQIGPFTLLRKLGAGPVSESFAGVDTSQSDRRVVVRRILPFVQQDRSRLASVEARVKDLLGVRHPFLVETLNWLEVDDERFVVEEWIEGVDLERMVTWCRQQKTTIPPNVFLNLATQICNGLEAIHGRPGSGTGTESVLHLGLRPASILMKENGKIQLGSFALTRSPTALSHASVSDPVPSHMEYLSPEQTHPDQKLTPSSDIFALGSIFYELLTLKPLFRADTSIQTIQRVRKAEITSQLLQVKDEMPGLDKVLYRALSVNPRHRYQRAFVLREDLRGLMANYSFSTIQEDTQSFFAPMVGSGQWVPSSLETAPDAPEDADDFKEQASTRIDPDPTATALMASQARAERAAAQDFPKDDSLPPGFGHAPETISAESEASELPEEPTAKSGTIVPPEISAPLDTDEVEDTLSPISLQSMAQSVDLEAPTHLGSAEDEERAPEPPAHKAPQPPPPVAAPSPPVYPTLPDTPAPPSIGETWGEGEFEAYSDDLESRRGPSATLLAGSAAALLLVAACVLFFMGGSEDNGVEDGPDEPIATLVEEVETPVEIEEDKPEEEIANEGDDSTETEEKPSAPPPPSTPVGSASTGGSRGSTSSGSSRSSRNTAPQVTSTSRYDSILASSPFLEPTPEETEDGEFEIPERTNLDSYASAASAGRLNNGEVRDLENIDLDDGSYTRSRALLLMNAERTRNTRSVGRYLEELMEVEENRYNPVFLSKRARWHANQGNYNAALRDAQKAEQHWARITPDLVFDTKSEIYEVQAASYQGLFYASEDDLEKLERAIRGWLKYLRHVSSRSRMDLVASAEDQLAKLEYAKQRLER